MQGDVADGVAGRAPETAAVWEGGLLDAGWDVHVLEGGEGFVGEGRACCMEEQVEFE